MLNSDDYTHYKRFTPNGTVSHRPITSSTKLILNEAEKLGINIEHIVGSEVFKLKYKDKTRYFNFQVLGTNSVTGYFITVNKRNTRNLLSQNKISIPTGYAIKKQDPDDYKKEVFEALKKPLVVKPNKGSQGKGVSMEIYTLFEYIRAIRKAVLCSSKTNPWIIVEEQLEEFNEYRVLVTKDKVIGVIKRIPANVIGDGASNIRKLVKIKNSDPRRGDYKDHPPLFKILIDEDAKETLEKQGLSWKFIPKEGERVFLRNASNISLGGDSIDFTDKVHNSVKEICLKAINTIPGLNLAGVDFMTRDICKKQEKDSYAILEVNESPGIDIHDYPYEGKNRKAGIEFLRVLFGEDF